MVEIGLYKKIEDANKIKEDILNNQKAYETNTFKDKIKDPNGLMVNTLTWNGYFETLRSVNIETLVFVRI